MGSENSKETTSMNHRFSRNGSTSRQHPVQSTSRRGSLPSRVSGQVPRLQSQPPACRWSGDSLDTLPKQTVASEADLQRVVDEFRRYWTLFNADKLADPRAAGSPLPRFDKRFIGRVEMRDLPHENPDYWRRIETRLHKLRSEATSYDIEATILSFGNLHHFNDPKLDVLHHLINRVLPTEQRKGFFDHILPGMVDLALSLPELLPKRIPLLTKSRNSDCQKLSLTQEQIACLLSHAFFCTFEHKDGQFPSINFNGIFVSGEYQVPCQRRIEKLKCILNYMDRVVSKKHLGVITISRSRIKPGKIRWSDRTETMPERLHVTSTGTIEDTTGGFLEVDFANKYLGGGALGHGLVQEEIRFMISPELIVTRLVTEALEDNEALHVEGFERFNDYSGYADSFRWIGDHQDARPVGVDRRRLSHLVAMDARCYRSWREQFSVFQIERELLKALVAFGDAHHYGDSLPQRPAVATGNWGCGAFKGDVKLKFLIQLMACSLAGRSMAYFTFGDQELQQCLQEMYQFLKDNSVLVGGVYNALIEYTEKLHPTADNPPDLFKSVREYVQLGRGASLYHAEPSGTSGTRRLPRRPVAEINEQPVNSASGYPIANQRQSDFFDANTGQNLDRRRDQIRPTSTSKNSDTKSNRKKNVYSVETKASDEQDSVSIGCFGTKKRKKPRISVISAPEGTKTTKQLSRRSSASNRGSIHSQKLNQRSEKDQLLSNRSTDASSLNSAARIKRRLENSSNNKKEVSAGPSRRTNSRQEAASGTSSSKSAESTSKWPPRKPQQSTGAAGSDSGLRKTS